VIGEEGAGWGGKKENGGMKGKAKCKNKITIQYEK
jgi:hypothetical protein